MFLSLMAEWRQKYNIYQCIFFETHFRKVDAFLEKVKTFQLYIYNINLICALNRTFSRELEMFEMLNSWSHSKLIVFIFIIIDVDHSLKNT